MISKVVPFTSVCISCPREMRTPPPHHPTSDSSSDVLMLSKVRNLEVSAADRVLIGSGADPLSHVISLVQSEAQNERGSAPNPLLIRDMLPRVM